MAKDRRVEKLPDWFEIPLSKRTAELCLFWQRSEGDALAILSGTISIKGMASVRHIEAACVVLDSHGSDGATRLAARLRRRTMTTSDSVPWYVDGLPPTVQKREQRDSQGYDKELACAFVTMAHRRCGNKGVFHVPGARGTFCPVHARRKAASLARIAARTEKKRAERAARKKTEPSAP